MDNCVNIPQHSGIPLLYKGVFSTRLNTKRKGTYGHYLNKLYHINFLGIGTYRATIEHDILHAVIVRHSSLTERVDDYLATPDKYSESLILESLGGNPVHAQRLDVVSPASVLGLVSSELKRLASVMNEIRSNKVAHIGNEAEQHLMKNLNDLKEAGILEVVDLEKRLFEADLPILSAGKVEGKRASFMYGMAGIAKIRMAEELLNRELAKHNLRSNTILIADPNVTAEITRQADILVEVLGTIERWSKKALVNYLPELARMSDREVALAHYLLVNEDSEYSKIVHDAYREILQGNSVSYRTVLEVIEELQRNVLRKGEENGELAAVRYVLKQMREESSLEFDRNVIRAGQEIEEKVQGTKVHPTTVEIKFDHEVKAEDTKTYLSLLDKLYYDFVRFSKQAEELEPKFYGIGEYGNDAVILDSLFGRDSVNRDNTHVLEELHFIKYDNKRFTELFTEHGELWNIDSPVFSDTQDEFIFAELTSEEEPITFVPDEDIFSEIVGPEVELTETFEVELFGELVSESEPLVPSYSMEMWGELVSEDDVLAPSVYQEMWGELANDPEVQRPETDQLVIGVKLFPDVGMEDTDYDIAVLSCSGPPDLKYRRRPDLEPDPEPEDPLFEWVCTEGYVCDDWLIVPLKDFNFENPDMDGFYDPVTWEPYFPTGHTDDNGDPYVLPPYSVLNEPISNGADVGGKEPMAINPCNLYSFIEYIVKIYDAYKTRFQGSTPIDTISRVMNMLYEQVEKLVAEWDESKEYTPDELWRIYRFIRWMALGITNRFYRVKIVYTYGDFVEQFEVYPFSELIRTEGSSRKYVPGYGWVLEGHPVVQTEQNKAYLDFELPKKTRSSTISFEVGNVVPDRPPEILPGGILFSENFEGLPDNFKIKGDGWVPVPTQGGTGLGVENPARVKTYRTNTFNVPTNAQTPAIQFTYGIDTNMETNLLLKRTDGTVVWRSVGVTQYSNIRLNNVAPGDYYFEVRVPQAEGNNMAEILFSAQQIQTEWRKVGYQTQWVVEGNVIYEDENTPEIAMVINPQWVQDSEYEFEVEFKTEDIPENYGLIDWIGVVLNYRDPNNYYAFGTWSHLDPQNPGGLLKVVNGQQQGSPWSPTWTINPDFRFQLGRWHKLRAVVRGNRFTIYIDGRQYLNVTDPSGWGHGASGLMAFSNPKSSFRNAKYRGKPRFDAYIDNVIVDAPAIVIPVEKPKYAIDFYLDNDSVPRVKDYSAETKRAYSFPILEGEHEAKWVFKKIGTETSESQDASFVDNIVVKGMKVVGAEVVEEFIGCGGHMAVKLLIENLLEYYRRHHQGCKGERNIWIIE